MAPKKSPAGGELSFAELEAQKKKDDLRAVHWELGNSQVDYITQANESFMSENRNQMIRSAIRAQTEPESKQLGKLLRKSHINLSLRPEPGIAKTESKLRFQGMRGDVSENFNKNGVELRTTNIDLAVADSKSAKGWSSVLKSTMSETEEQKFACKQPDGFQELGAELRKSNVLLHAGRHDFRQSAPPVHRSQTSMDFNVKPLSPTVGFAQTLGKELRTSSFGIGGDAPKSCTHWQSQQHSIMGNNNQAKWKCEKPQGFDHLIAELRKTNITLGSDRTVYGTESLKRAVKPRDERPAGRVV